MTTELELENKLLNRVWNPNIAYSLNLNTGGMLYNNRGLGMGGNKMNLLI